MMFHLYMETVPGSPNAGVAAVLISYSVINMNTKINTFNSGNNVKTTHWIKAPAQANKQTKKQTVAGAAWLI